MEVHHPVVDDYDFDHIIVIVTLTLCIGHLLMVPTFSGNSPYRFKFHHHVFDDYDFGHLIVIVTLTFGIEHLLIVSTFMMTSAETSVHWDFRSSQVLEPPFLVRCLSFSYL